MKHDLEKFITELISESTEAKSIALSALQDVKKNNISTAKQKITLAEQKLLECQEMQNYLIQKEATGEKIPLSLLLVHAQDHLMNAILAKDLIKEIILINESKE